MCFSFAHCIWLSFLQNHAFARYVLPVASDAFGKQRWPGKKEETSKKNDKPQDAKKPLAKPPLSNEEQRMYDNLLKEMDTRRNFQNDVGKPDGDLKPLDTTALEQLESRLSIEDQ